MYLYNSLSICTRMYVNEMLIFDNNYALRIGTVWFLWCHCTEILWWGGYWKHPSIARQFFQNFLLHRYLFFKKKKIKFINVCKIKKCHRQGNFWTNLPLTRWVLIFLCGSKSTYTISFALFEHACIILKYFLWVFFISLNETNVWILKPRDGRFG